MVIKSLDSWGNRTCALLPANIRAALENVPLPNWLIAELRLHEGATVSDLGRNIWNAPDVESVSPRARSYVVNLVRSRQKEILELNALDRPWPAALDPHGIPWTVRTQNCLRNSGLIENPAHLERVTFGELLDMRAMGWLSVIDFACTTEAAIDKLDTLLATNESEAPTSQSSLVKAIDAVWADQISEQDPRFADLMPPGEGTVLERLEQLTSEPGDNLIPQVALGEAVGRIEARTRQVAEMPLEDALNDLLRKLSGLSGRKLDGLAARLGWSGNPPVTLREAGEIMGLTRQRVNQIQEQFAKRMPEHPIFMPQIDRATETIRQHAPLSIADANKLLRKKRISRIDFHPRSLFSIATTCGHTPGFTVDRAREAVVTDATAEISGAIAQIARKQAGSSGATNLQEVIAQLVKQGAEIDEERAKRYLQTVSEFEFLEDDWFWCPRGKIARNRLRNVTRKMLSVASPIKVSTLREGLKRVYKYRESTSSWPLAVLPRSVLRPFYQAHPEFVLREDDYVESTRLLSYQELLGKTERTLVDVVRSSPASVLDRASFARECLKRGLKRTHLWDVPDLQPHYRTRWYRYLVSEGNRSESSCGRGGSAGKRAECSREEDS